MLITITTTHRPATDLGYLLYKHPERVQRFDQPSCTATVFYPEATEDRCTAALMLEVDALRLAKARGRRSPDFALAQYVNDRPYAAGSMLASALADVFRTARTGRCDARQELADSPIPLEISIPTLPCRDGADLVTRIFGPLGWSVTADPIPLDDAFPDWGDSRYLAVRLTGDVRLADALNQLYVLLPAFDMSKHYWQSDDEVDKLLRAGEGWLAAHPERDLITGRYLSRTGGLDAVARARLAELDDTVASDEPADTAPSRPSLNVARHDAVLAVLHDLAPSSVIDFGCGSGQLLSKVLRDTGIPKVAGCDVSMSELRRAHERLHVDDMTERQADRLTLFQAALTYEDDRFAGYDAAVLMEVIEHVDPPRLGALERVVFGAAAPKTVILTTPSSDYNPLYENLDGLRHTDHRFEWSRAEFAAWSDRVAADHGYRVTRSGIGEVDDVLGSPTQMAVFTRD